MTPFSSANTVPQNDAFLASLLGIRPDVLQPPPLNLPPATRVGPATPKVGQAPIPPSLARQVAQFIAEIAPGTGEGMAAAETLEALKKGKGGEAALAALGLLPAGGDVAKGVVKAIRKMTKKAAPTDLDAIMWSPNTGYFEGIKGRKTVYTARHSADELRAMLGEDTWNRLVSTDYAYDTYRLEAMKPGVAPKPFDPAFPPRPGPYTPQPKPTTQVGTAKIIETLAALGMLGAASATSRQ